MPAHVLVDANVLYSRCLTDWISLAAIRGGGMYTVRWTEDILVEARYHLRKDHPAAPDGALTTRFDRIRELFPEGRIDRYEIVDRRHPDEADWHVVSAAIAADVDYLVTSDKKFNACAEAVDRDSWPFEVHTPDTFLVLIDDSNPAVVRDVTMYQYDYWIRNQVTTPMSETLERAGAKDFAQRVAAHIHDRLE